METVKITNADKLNENRSNARNVGSSDSGTAIGCNAWQIVLRGRGQQSRTQQNRGGNMNGNIQNSRGSYYGTSTGSRGGISMGAPLPSRFVVIERVNKEITKEDVKKTYGEQENRTQNGETHVKRGLTV